MAASGEVVKARRARKAPRMTFRQEIRVIENLPRTQRLIVILKIAGVFLVAIGLEGIVTADFLFAVAFIPLGILVSLLPIRIKTGRCVACMGILEEGQAICPACGAPQM